MTFSFSLISSFFFQIVLYFLSDVYSSCGNSSDSVLAPGLAASIKYVDTVPLPLTSIVPRTSVINCGASAMSFFCVNLVHWKRCFNDVDSMRDAKFTVSPKRQKRGLRSP